MSFCSQNSLRLDDFRLCRSIYQSPRLVLVQSVVFLKHGCLPFLTTRARESLCCIFWIALLTEKCALFQSYLPLPGATSSSPWSGHYHFWDFWFAFKFGRRFWFCCGWNLEKITFNFLILNTFLVIKILILVLFLKFVKEHLGFCKSSFQLDTKVDILLFAARTLYIYISSFLGEIYLFQIACPTYMLRFQILLDM